MKELKEGSENLLEVELVVTIHRAYVVYLLFHFVKIDVDGISRE